MTVLLELDLDVFAYASAVKENLIKNTRVLCIGKYSNKKQVVLTYKAMGTIMHKYYHIGVCRLKITCNCQW